MSWNNKEEQ